MLPQRAARQNDITRLEPTANIVVAPVAVGTPLNALRAKRMERAVSAPQFAAAVHGTQSPLCGSVGSVGSGGLGGQAERASRLAEPPAKAWSLLDRKLNAAMRAGSRVGLLAGSVGLDLKVSTESWDLHAPLWSASREPKWGTLGLGVALGQASKAAPTVRSTSLGTLRAAKQLPGALPAIIDKARPAMRVGLGARLGRLVAAQ